MKKEIMIEEFIKNLDVKIPDKEDFFQLSRIIPINPKRSDYFHVNFERGMLLYALITKYRPKNILEIGAGYTTPFLLLKDILLYVWHGLCLIME